MATKSLFLTVVYLILLNQQAAGKKLSSPCPDVFTYQTEDEVGNNWHGKVNMESAGTLKIVLSKPAEALTSPSGEVTSSDKTTYTISNITNNTAEFLVSYNGRRPVPTVIELDGKTICSESTRSARQIFVDGFLRPEQSVLFNYEIDQFLCGVTAEQEYSFLRSEQLFKEVKYPWHAAIFVSDLGKLKYGCGGSLISRYFVLTAAHCLQGFARLPLRPSDIQIQLGKYNLNTGSPGQQIHEVSDVYIHPSYSRINYANNVALIKLKTPAQYDDFVRPVCLWKGDANYDSLVGSIGKAVGWGLRENLTITEELADADLILSSYKDCQQIDYSSYFQYQSGGLYCAGYQNGTSICQGDAGGGMVFLRQTLRGNVYFLRGVISAPNRFLSKCDDAQTIRFTDVAKYLDFINAYVK